MIQPDRSSVARALRNARSALLAFERGNPYTLQYVGYWMGIAEERATNAEFSVWEQTYRVLKFLRNRLDRRVIANQKQMHIKQAREFMGYDKEGMRAKLEDWGVGGDDKQ